MDERIVGSIRSCNRRLFLAPLSGKSNIAPTGDLMYLKLLVYLSSFTLSAEVFAQAAGGAKAPTLTESLLLPMAVVFGIVYFMMIRPQAKKQKQHDELLKGLKPGDEVVTSGGIIGRVKSVAEQFVSLELSPNTSMKIQKSHIAGLSKPQDSVKPQTVGPTKNDK